MVIIKSIIGIGQLFVGLASWLLGFLGLFGGPLCCNGSEVADQVVMLNNAGSQGD